jgi:hypothetical protein
MILEQRFITERSLAIRPTLQFHLNDTEVNPKLQLFMSIVAHDLARFYLSGLMRPPVQQVVQVKIAHSREISKDEGEMSKGDKGASLLVIVLVLVLDWAVRCGPDSRLAKGSGQVLVENTGDKSRGRLRWASSAESRPPPETQ